LSLPSIARAAIDPHIRRVNGQPPALFLFGGTELRGIPADAANRLLGQSKVVALLAYLALAGKGRYMRRDRVVGLLWPELDQAHARAALRKAIHAIRGTLGDDSLLARSDEEITLPTEALSCDVVDFHAHVDGGRLASALELYRGDLLDGFHLTECSDFELWLDGERSVVKERAAAAAMALSKSLESDNQYSMAGVWARRAMHFSWSNERVLRQSLSMLERIGDRAGALRLYEDFARRLRQELDAQPSAETTSLVAKLRG
jgi:DNA-binding SARP family transcriptional activator